MNLFSRVIPLLMLAVCTVAFAESAVAKKTTAKTTTDGLWATFDVAGERLELRIPDEATAQYVKSFAAGHETPRRFCDKTTEVVQSHLGEWIQDTHDDCPYVAQVTRLKECRGGECVTLKGMYAGRSPGF